MFNRTKVTILHIAVGQLSAQRVHCKIQKSHILLKPRELAHLYVEK
jgi:hypothetical protein